MDIIIANVPHEVPVEKAIKQLTRKMIKGTRLGDNQFCETDAIYSHVPSSLHKLPIVKASTIRNDRGTIPDMPFNVRSTSSFPVSNF